MSRPAMRQAAAVLPVPPPINSPDPMTGPNGEWLSYEPADNFTKLDNRFRKLIDRKAGKKLGGVQWELIMSVWLDTIGGKMVKGKRPAYVRIPEKVYATLLACNVRTIQRNLIDLCERGILQQQRDPDDARFKVYRVRPDLFELAPPTRIDEEVAETDDDEVAETDDDEVAETDDDEVAETDDDEVAAVQVTSEPLILLPGKRSRPVPFSAAVSKARWDNQSGIPLRIEAGLQNDLLVVRVLRETATVPDTRPSARVSAQPAVAKQVIDKRQECRVPGSQTADFIAQLENEKQSTRLTLEAQFRSLSQQRQKSLQAEVEARFPNLKNLAPKERQEAVHRGALDLLARELKKQAGGGGHNVLQQRRQE